MQAIEQVIALLGHHADTLKLKDIIKATGPTLKRVSEFARAMPLKINGWKVIMYYVTLLGFGLCSGENVGFKVLLSPLTRR